MFTTNLPARRTVLRIGVGAAAALAAAVSLPGVAQAHVTIQPPAAEPGGFSVVAFRVPNERDDATTTRLQVTLPEDQPLGEVSTTPIPGWRVKTTTRQLDQPIDMFGEQLDEVVSKVTWTATGGGIRPGEYQDFDVSVGQLPESGELVFPTLQTYSNGEKVNWNQVSADEADEAAEPEHPAPTLSIAASPTAQAGTDQATDAGAQQAPAVSSAASTDDGSDALPLALSGAALLVSLLTALLVWRRGRPVKQAQDASPRTFEGTRV
jgi:periplasmic copper chaperone A